MFTQGLIDSRTYSLYLNDIGTADGSILFGGLDLDKFTGPLHTLPLNAGPSGTVSRFYITLTNMTIASGSSTISVSGTYPINALLDSGTTALVFPSGIYHSFLNIFGATGMDPTTGFPRLSECPPRGSLNFHFSGAEIQVPFQEFVVESNGACNLLVESSDSPCAILGDAFLRSAYVVYDLVRITPWQYADTNRIIRKSRWGRQN